MCSYRICIIEISQRETGFQKSSKPNYRFSKCGISALFTNRSKLCVDV